MFQIKYILKRKSKLFCVVFEVKIGATNKINYKCRNFKQSSDNVKENLMVFGPF